MFLIHTSSPNLFSFLSFAIQSELLALRRAHLEISHQLETANEEVRALSLRLQENVSIKYSITFLLLLLTQMKSGFWWLFS